MYLESTYQFSDDKTGTYSADMGLMSSKQPFTWSVANDSITIRYQRENRPQRYHVATSADGFTLKSDSITIDLMQR